jgi:hypothetical protein
MPYRHPLRDSEDGQALAEFALVLPMLALLTFGTIEVAIWLQQQSSINAAAFMASRASSVLGGELNKTRSALTDYIDVSPPWLGRAIAGMKKSGGSNRIELQARADRFTGLISALTGGEVSGFDTLAAGAALPLEYDPRAHNQAKTGPKSRFLIDYRVPATEKALAPAAVANAGKAVDAVKKAVRDALPVVQIEPSPKPPSGGTTPKPPGSGGAPSSGTAPPLQLPNIKALEALKVDGEDFKTRGAVPGNPKDHGKSLGGFSSLFYLGHQFESQGDRKAPWTSKTIAQGLKEAETNVSDSGAGLAQTCENVARFIKVAEKHPVYGPYVKGFDRKVRPWTQALTKGLDAEAKTREARERALFSR